ncbi:MAG: sulfotransferase, partial [Gemmatimonadota bacterium]
MNRVRILYIIGPTRSGSTLLARLLNECPGIVSVGELVSLDVALQSSRLQAGDRGTESSMFVPNDAAEDAARRRSALCGCMLPLHDCPIWSRVEACAFGDPPDYSRWSWEARRPSLGQFLLGGSKRWRGRNNQAFGEIAESAYREVVRLTNARIVVDDSKTPLYGYFLMKEPWAEVVPVRLVRDPRATAASWSRPKSYPGVEGGRMPTHSSLVCSVDWLKRVALADRLFKESLLVRYEDFVAAPAQVAGRLLAAAGATTEQAGRGPAVTGAFGTNHILAGNPDKFERGEVRIRPPSDWSETLRPGPRAVVTATTLP